MKRRTFVQSLPLLLGAIVAKASTPPYVFRERLPGAMPASSHTRSSSDAIIQLFSQTGAMGGYYDISDIASLYQDSGFSSPVSASGQSVGGVRDKSGNGLDLTAPSGSYPVYDVSTGHPNLVFNGTSDYLVGPLSYQGPCVVCIGFSIISYGIAYSGLFSSYDTTPASATFQIGETGNVGEVRLDDGGSGNATLVGPITGIGTSNHVLSVVFTNVGTDFRLDGSSAFSSSFTSALFNSLVVGANRNLNKYSNIRLYAMAALAADVSADIATIEKTIGSKAGLSV